MKNYKPRIGKNVIETLTLGMYENPLVIYREYVQNAVDQIDIAVENDILDTKSDGRVDICIDKNEKTISIKDNATGIKSNEVLKFLGDVANSQKDREKHKGFRGIGRLGGLGYCEKLIFETSYKGESIKSIITLNAKQLRRIIEDRKIKMDASTVISVITELEKEEEAINKHYFIVKLIEVTNPELLEIDKVKDYLSMVAPIPFSKDFLFSKKIYAYKNHFLKNDKIISLILDINFFEIKNNENEIIALAWYGISDLLNFIIKQENIERGFRLRRDNIQIGDQDTLNLFFNEDRFNHHFIGEIYLIGNAFIPNARRDYFNDNKTIQYFEQQIKEEFKKLKSLSHTASKINNRTKEIEEFKEKKQKFENTKYRSEAEEIHYKKELADYKKKAKKAKNKLRNISKKARKDKSINVIFKHIVDKEHFAIEKTNNVIENKNYKKHRFSKLNEKEEKIVLEIFSIIDENLEIDNAENIKQKIIEYYN